MVNGSWLMLHGSRLMGKKGAWCLNWDPKDSDLDQDPGPVHFSTGFVALDLFQ